MKAEWVELIRSGELHRLFEAPSQRLQLTIQCQLCHMSYQRSNDLALHLQTVHAQLWQQSQRFHPLLLQVCQAEDGCYCNPRTNAGGLAHTCPALRQLCMLAIRIGQEMFLPWQYTPDSVSKVLTTNQQGAINILIQQCLKQREFTQLWSDPALMHTMSTQCLFCGGLFPTAALRDHVCHQHSGPGTLDFEVTAQLVPCFHAHQAEDHVCHACHQIFNLPGQPDLDDQALHLRRQLAHLHLAHQCPVLYQVALLLTHGASRRINESDPRRLRNVRGLWTDEPSLGDVRQKHRRRKRNQETQEGRPTSKTSRRGPGDQNHAGNGSAASEDGRRTTGPEKARLLDLLHANRQGSSSAHAVGTGCTVEEISGDSDQRAADDLDPVENSPAEVHGQDASRAPSSTALLGSAVSNDGHGQAALLAGQRGQFPVPTLESQHTDAPGDLSTAHWSQSHGEVHRAIPGADSRSSLCDEVPSPTSCGLSQGGPVVATSGHQTGRLAAPSSDAPGKHHLEHAGHAGQTSQPATKSSGSVTEGFAGQGTHQGQGQGQEQAVKPLFPTRNALRRCVEQLSLSNQDNWCFINAAFLATIWAMLSCRGFRASYWGRHASDLAAFLRTSTEDPLNFAAFPAFLLLVRSWEDRVRQGDAVEFITHLLRGFDFSGFDMRWEIRLQIGSVTHLHDQNEDCCNPVVLQFDPAQLEDSHVQLQHMIMAWSNQHGRQTAMLNPAPLICVHIDRCIVSGDGSIGKTDAAIQVHGGCELPFYVDSDLQVVWKAYHVVSQIAHLGRDNAGHCRAILHIAPTQQEGRTILALLTEDWTKAESISRIPYWFSSNVTCLWLCRDDQLDLYQPSTNTANEEVLHFPQSVLSLFAPP